MKTVGRPLISCLLWIVSTGFSITLSAADGSGNPPPNIIVILADDLGYGDLGCYGCKDIQTPNLDRLADTGVRLTDGYVSHPYCGPSRAGLMTGRYQQRFGYQWNPSHQPTNQTLGLDVEEETLGDVFRRAGYKTGAFGKWHLGAAEQFHPNNRGFDEFYGFLDGGHHYFPDQYPDFLKKYASQSPPPTPELFAYAQPLEINGMPLPPVSGYLTDLLTNRALGFMERMKDRPFFVYLAYNAPHIPLEAPERLITKYSGIQDKTRRVYAAMVDSVDENVGRLLAFLDRSGLRHNTAVVFLSDNGGDAAHGASNGLLRGGKSSTWEGGVRVPFLLSWPAGLPAGKTVSVPVSSLDLLPTLAAIAGVRPAGKPLDGVDVLPWLRGGAEGFPHPCLFWLSHNVMSGVLNERFKAVRNSPSSSWQLFHLPGDPGEKNDVSSQNKESMQKIQKAYDEWISEMPPARWKDPD